MDDHIKNSPIFDELISGSPTIRLELDQPDDIAAATDWDIDFKQIEPGQMQTRLAVQAGLGTALAGISMSRGVHQRGAAPNGFITFGIVDPSTLKSWQSNEVADNTLLSFSPVDGFDSISEAGHNGVVLSFEENTFL